MDQGSAADGVDDGGEIHLGVTGFGEGGVDGGGVLAEGGLSAGEGGGFLGEFQVFQHERGGEAWGRGREPGSRW